MIYGSDLSNMKKKKLNGLSYVCELIHCFFFERICEKKTCGRCDARNGALPVAIHTLAASRPGSETCRHHVNSVYCCAGKVCYYS